MNDGAAHITSEFLAQEAQVGDLSALEALIERHRHEVYRVGLRMLSNVADAEEVMQNTFERMIRHLGSYDPSRAFRPWLMRIALNRARSLYRKRKVMRFLRLDDAPPLPASLATHPQHALEGKHAGQALLAALQKIPASHRECFILKHIEGYSYEEMSEITGETVTNLKVRVHRTRRKILDEMADDGETK